MTSRTDEQKRAKVAANARWRAKNRDKVRSYGRKYYYADPEARKAKHREYYRRNAKKRIAAAIAWAKKNPEKAKRNGVRSSRKRHGVCPDAAEKLLAEHDGRCACCGVTAPGGRYSWNIDHDHNTGRIRGVLCFNCNLGIGKLGDTLEGVLRAVSYLKRSTTEKE